MIKKLSRVRISVPLSPTHNCWICFAFPAQKKATFFVVLDAIVQFQEGIFGSQHHRSSDPKTEVGMYQLDYVSIGDASAVADHAGDLMLYPIHSNLYGFSTVLGTAFNMCKFNPTNHPLVELETFFAVILTEHSGNREQIHVLCLPVLCFKARLTPFATSKSTMATFRAVRFSNLEFTSNEHFMSTSTL